MSARAAQPVPGGRRRIDRVLADGYADALAELSMDELRSRRREAEQEETDLSFTRRMLQGRLDILRAERARRAGGDTGSLVDRLADILADSVRQDRGLGRHLDREPSRLDERRRSVEQVISDVGISDVSALDDSGLEAALERVGALERAVSEQRARVQAVVDRLTAEVGRRYAAGGVDIAEALRDA